MSLALCGKYLALIWSLEHSLDRFKSPLACAAFSAFSGVQYDGLIISPVFSDAPNVLAIFCLWRGSFIASGMILCWNRVSSVPSGEQEAGGPCCLRLIEAYCIQTALLRWIWVLYPPRFESGGCAPWSSCQINF